MPKHRLEGLQGCKIIKLVFKLKMIGLMGMICTRGSTLLWFPCLQTPAAAAAPFGTGSTACLGKAGAATAALQTHMGHERQCPSEEVTPGTNDRAAFFCSSFCSKLTADHLEPHTFLGQLCTTQIMFLS